MAQQTINIGAAPDDGTGDTLRDGGDKINDNFTELYAADAALGTAAALDVDPDDTLAADSDSLIPTQQAVKAYVDASAGGVAELDDVGDVNAPTPADGDVLTWDATPGEWVSAAPTGGSNALDDLTDVDAPTPADGDVLTFDSGSGDWVPAAPSGGGDWTLIDTETPSGTATATFSSIPGTYKALKVIAIGRSTTSGTGGALVQMRCNSDSGSNYGTRRMIAAASFLGSVETSVARIISGEVPKAGCQANMPGMLEVLIPFYADTTFAKVASGAYQLFPNNDLVVSHYTFHGWWNNTAAITQIDFILDSGNWVAGSKLALYGLS